MTTVVAVIAGLATIIGGIVWVVKFTVWKTQKTPAQIDQEIEQKNQADKQQAEESGRPV